MLESWIAEQNAHALDRRLSRPELERISLLIDIDRVRPSFRKRVAGTLVRLGLRLDPSVGTRPARVGVARPEPSSR